MRVLVTGGAGYIGSIINEELLNGGHDVIVFDNLSKGHRAAVDARAKFVEGDISDVVLMTKTLKENQIEAVVHMAADSLVGESVQQPEKYFQNNVVNGLKLLAAMRDCGVLKLVFSSTAAVYGDPARQPIEESDPAKPTNPYGETKLAFEQALRAHEDAYHLRYASLRYFNAAGASEQFGEGHNPETHLIPLVLQAANGTRAEVQIFGDDYPTSDGTCVRDYIHVIDLARAHVLALGILNERSAIYNVGCGGDGYTVKQVIDTAREITGREIKTRIAPRRSGDPAVLIASSEKIHHEIGWKSEFQDLRSIVKSAWDWLQKHPRGYES